MPIKAHSAPLKIIEKDIPVPESFDIVIKVTACGICHTELDEIEGRIPLALPVVPGHQAIGSVEIIGDQVKRFRIGDRVGVAWIYSACGHCFFCKKGLENLCPEFKATGRDVDGGYAQYLLVHEQFAYTIPETFTDLEAAPLLCGGAIGFRSLFLTQLENGANLGLTGFGSSGHLVLKMAKYLYPQSKIYVFARNSKQRIFAEELGADWTGGIMETPPEKMHAIIDTTPAWRPVVGALANLSSGGRLVINAIRKQKEDKKNLKLINYEKHLWKEKEVKSVANVCRSDVTGFLRLAAAMDLQPEIETYPFEDANKALYDLKKKSTSGSKVLKIL